MPRSWFPFVDTVVAARDLVVTSTHKHGCRLEPRESEIGWHCDLDDGFVNTNEYDPASSVRWVCPALRSRGEEGPQLDVRRPGPHSDLGKVVRAVGRMLGRAPRDFAEAGAEGPYVYDDDARILDADLRDRVEHWPAAMHGDGVVRPAELSAIRVTREGLIVGSSSWWDSAPALDHQIALSLDIARRLAAGRPSPPGTDPPTR